MKTFSLSGDDSHLPKWKCISIFSVFFGQYFSDETQIAKLEAFTRTMIEYKSNIQFYNVTLFLPDLHDLTWPFREFTYLDSTCRRCGSIVQHHNSLPRGLDIL